MATSSRQQFAHSTGERDDRSFRQDPDADRLAIVDERGEYIGEEYTLVLAAKRRLDRQEVGAARPRRAGSGRCAGCGLAPARRGRNSCSWRTSRPAA
ncbi:MAG: hypothetical protein U0575_13460 [Phycisphaerales bacterium]